VLLSLSGAERTGGTYVSTSNVGSSAGLPIRQRGGATSSSFPKDGECRLVTVLFADLVGFTAFTAHAGAEHAYALMQRVSKLLNTTVREQGCVIKTFTGDGIVAFFGAPAALEDAPLRRAGQPSSSRSALPPRWTS
jgi:class 3 adenylate cyclase